TIPATAKASRQGTAPAPLSHLDTALTGVGHTAADALGAAVELARLADRRGFARYRLHSQCLGLEPEGEANLWPALPPAGPAGPRFSPPRPGRGFGGRMSSSPSEGAPPPPARGKSAPAHSGGARQ